ncbi:ankyrin repeat domain-containing protein [Acidobacteria bacterium AH-259-G07]|nr:ankyrin repeat domain-containing protein [Acidobacteria bacterium AH-259-G07]
MPTRTIIAMLLAILMPFTAYAQDVNSKLIEAARAGQTEEVQALLDAGADVNGKDKDGQTALMWVAFMGHTEIELRRKSGTELSAWDQYLQVRSRFYYLDQQDFNDISCKVEAPTLTNLISQAQLALTLFKDNLEIQDNLSDFRLNFNKSTGLLIDSPKLDVKITSESGMPDPARLRSEIQSLKTHFKRLLDSVEAMLRSIFVFYTFPKKQDEITQVVEDNGVYTFIYRKEGIEVIEIYSGNQIERKQTEMGGEILSKENHVKTADGKLILTDANMSINQPMVNVETNVSVSYQEIGSIVFPSHIVSHSKQSIQGMRTETQIDIYLKDCKAY